MCTSGYMFNVEDAAGGDVSEVSWPQRRRHVAAANDAAPAQRSVLTIPMTERDRETDRDREPEGLLCV